MPILSENLFPVVGVGASAGGLEAFKELLKAIPEDSGMAYILVQHLAPNYESILTDILKKTTGIPVLKITDSIKVRPNHIYIIPPNKLVTANDDMLQLATRPETEKVNTIDVFFTSLAEVHQQYAIGIILSGTGSDGTVGLKTIKDQGGITVVQDANSSAYYDMAQSAIDAEVVDFVLPPHEIPRHLQQYLRISDTVAASVLHLEEDGDDEETFKRILALLRAKRGVDFTNYKQTTIRRRILRRQALNKTEKLKDYQNYLFENKDEQDALYKDILIPVTAFFRDAKPFVTLGEKVFPVLFKKKTTAETIRIWIAGCSTGEEAYSLAICVWEYFKNKNSVIKIQIFATDISEASIAKARSGIYKKTDLAGVSENRLKQFFTKQDGSYQVNKVIREMCVFACHNFLKDPPFARMDLVSCRNVLIYMESNLQKKALTTFHYALNNGGILFLGKSESIGQLNEFGTVSKEDKIYKRNTSAGKFISAITEGNETLMRQKNDNLKNRESVKNEFQVAAADALLSRYTTVGVIVNEQSDILQFIGVTSAYLQAPSGKASLNILTMAKEGLSFELRNALHKAKSSNKAVRKKSIFFDGGKRNVSLEVIPLRNTAELYFLVLFEDPANEPPIKNTKEKKKLSKEEETKFNAEFARIEQLEKELFQVRKDMHFITEDQEAVNEELQSANEELLSGNEELQTLNEELETTKEEIQSSNEELAILNQELIDRNEQLVYSRKFAEAIVTTIHEPLIILTGSFQVKGANKCFYEKFNVTDQQIHGKMFFELDGEKWNLPELRERLQKILPEHSYFEGFEVTVAASSKTDSTFALNARQLLNENSNEQLILLSMQDITERKELDQIQKMFSQKLEMQVNEQTKELKKANLNLSHSNENLKQFASIASHDLQEPLRKVKTFTAILKKRYSKDVPDEGKEIINKIGSSTDRMSQLIKELLEYSKLAREAKEFVKTDLDSILKNVIADLDLLVSETGASITYKEALPVIKAIPLQINQLFYNLLTNAIKFKIETKVSEVVITCKKLLSEEIKKIEHLKEDLSYIEIKFSDNGIGFEQQFADQIFQIFERLHSQDEFEGTGIGLALCKKIVENHNGYIYAISAENEGASFYVILPVAQ